MDFKKILKVITTIVAIVGAIAAVYVLIQKLTAKEEPQYFDDNEFFECDNELEIVEVEEAPAEEPKKKAAPKKKTAKA